MSEQDLGGRTFFITGANAGIGRTTALRLGGRGATLFLAGRSEERTRPVIDEIKRAGNDDVTFLPLALDDLASVRACADAFLEKDVSLDVLINNAGLAGSRGLTKDGFELIFGVNHLGPFLLTELLRERLVKTAKGKGEPGRIVNVASKMHYQVKKVPWGTLEKETAHVSAMPEYGVSKLFNILHAKALASQLEGENVRTYALHPGVVASDVWRGVPWPFRPVIKAFMLSPEDGALTSLFCATSSRVSEQTGRYYDLCKEKAPSSLAEDAALAEELYGRSMKWTGLA